jgi:hypothetical protein
MMMMMLMMAVLQTGGAVNARWTGQTWEFHGLIASRSFHASSMCLVEFPPNLPKSHVTLAPQLITVTVAEGAGTVPAPAAPATGVPFLSFGRVRFDF